MNAALANSLGNMLNRAVTLLATHSDSKVGGIGKLQEGSAGWGVVRERVDGIKEGQHDKQSAHPVSHAHRQKGERQQGLSWGHSLSRVTNERRGQGCCKEACDLKPPYLQHQGRIQSMETAEWLNQGFCQNLEGSRLGLIGTTMFVEITKGRHA